MFLILGNFSQAVMKESSVPANGRFGMLFVNNFLSIEFTYSRVAVFISGTSSEFLVTGTSLRSIERIIYHLMLTLHNGTFLHLQMRCLETGYFCFGLHCFILPCKGSFCKGSFLPLLSLKKL